MASEIKVDTISEKTSAGGVTIDGLLIKDGGISGDVSLIGTTPTFTIGDAGAEDAALVFDGNAKDFYIALDDSADKLVIGEGSTVGTNSILTITDDSVTVGDAAAVDTKIVFDGNAQDYHIGLDDSADTLVLGLGSTLGTTPAMTVNSSQVVTFAQNPVFPDGGVAVADLDIDGATDIGANIVDADLFIIDDGAGGTNRKTAASRLKTYIGGGQWELIASATCSDDANKVISGANDSDYQTVLITFSKIIPVEDGTEIKVKMFNASNSDFGSYSYTGIGQNDAASTLARNDSGASVMDFIQNIGSDTNEHGVSGQFWIHQPAGATQASFNGQFFGVDASDNATVMNIAGMVDNDSAAVNGIKVYFGNGNIESGELRMYGLKNA